MTSSGLVTGSELWPAIRAEAETAMARDPIFGASLSAAILDHADLGSAVAFQIGEREQLSFGVVHCPWLA